MDAGDLTSLRGRVRGEVVVPGDAGGGFETLAGARSSTTGADWGQVVAGFNAAVRHQPDVVVVAAGAADVQEAVRFAAAAGMPVSVMATGHGLMAAVEGGLMISTRRMDAVSIDPEARTATVQGGACWKAVIEAGAPYGLAPLNGSSSGVGAVGFTLGGGLPVMGRAFGFAADHVRSLELVTADGELHHVDATSEPDLFWGLRGGGGNLGVVTEMTVDLVPVATIYGGGILYPAEHVPAVLHAWRTWCADLPETISSSVAILRLPPLPEVPEPIRGKTLAHLRFCAVGTDGGAVDVEAATAALAPMREVAPAVIDSVAEIPYAAIDGVHMDPDHPSPFCQRGELLHEVTAETVDALLAVAGPQHQLPMIVCEFRQLGGALARPPEGGNAVGGREAGYLVSAVGLAAPEVAVPGAAAVDAVIDSTAPWSTDRTTLNLHGTFGDEADRARAWDVVTYQRLGELVARHDPAGMFRYGHTIARAGS